MSADFGIRSVGAFVSPIVQVQSPAVGQAVATDLPASQSVSATSSGSAASNDAQAALNSSHQAYFDRAAGTVVYQVVNDKTDQVVDQYPDEQVLRRRAYFNSLDQTKGTAN